MKYRITHNTVYDYSQPVGLCQNEAKLSPRDFWRQRCLSSQLNITPNAMDYQERLDYFGNRVAYFAVQQAHTRLVVSAVNEVLVLPAADQQNVGSKVSWEQVQNILTGANLSSSTGNGYYDLLEAKQFMIDSPMIAVSAQLADYASLSFSPRRPLKEVVTDLMQRIHHDFTYDPAFTTVATPLSEVLAHRRGVCQDFAHLAIGCLRAYGIPARYISGYIETTPEPGVPRLVGADASHAWFAVYLPDAGWMDFDPTNNSLPYDQHITVAWGRDYSDVTPLKGIAFGGGQHTLSVSVDVLRLE
ncbi:MAG: transglutaminase [Methylobacter sp.]|nr:MAG: transglutaminase [Methylobacter sp.]